MRTIATKHSTDGWLSRSRNNLNTSGRSVFDESKRDYGICATFLFATIGSWLSGVNLFRLGVLPSGIPQIPKHSSIV